MSNMWQSSNPAFNNDAFSQIHDPGAIDQRLDQMSASGVVNKTGIFIFTAMVTGAVGYSTIFALGTNLLMVSAIVAFLITVGAGFILCKNPARAREIGFVYAAVEGFFLGGLTALVDSIFEAKGLAVAGGAGLQAFIITMACLCSMLTMYKLGWIRPTARFNAIIRVATGAIMISYLVSFVMSFFGAELPLIGFTSAVSDKGMMGFIGIGVNLFILAIATLYLIIDFGEIEKHIQMGAPKHMEWYFGFSLMITLAWIYFEALKLVLRLAVMFGDRD